MTNRYLLTVGIPTYNGAAYIGDALESVLRQIDASNVSQIEILILDNASVDDTASVVGRYRPELSDSIRYVRNETNVGFDRNVDRIFKHAQGRHVWLLADDDVLEPGAIVYVMGILERFPEMGAVLVNFDQYDRELKQLIDQVPLEHELHCTDPSTFLKNSRSRYNLVSALTFNRAAWNSLDLTRGIGTNFVHVHALMEIILHFDSYIVPRSLVRMRMGSVSTGTSGNSRLSIALDAGAIIQSMREMGHEPRLVSSMLKDARRYTFDMIPDAKLAGLSNKRALIKRLVSVYNSPQLWLKWIPVIYLPDRAFRPLYTFKKAVSRKLKFFERYLRRLIGR